MCGHRALIGANTSDWLCKSSHRNNFPHMWLPMTPSPFRRCTDITDSHQLPLEPFLPDSRKDLKGRGSPSKPRCPAVCLRPILCRENSNDYGSPLLSLSGWAISRKNDFAERSHGPAVAIPVRQKKYCYVSQFHRSIVDCLPWVDLSERLSAQSQAAKKRGIWGFPCTVKKVSARYRWFYGIAEKQVSVLYQKWRRQQKRIKLPKK